MIDLASLAWVSLSFLFIPLSGWIAERRGRSIKFWCWLGFISGPIAPVVLALLPPSDEPGGRPPAAPNGSGLWRRTHGRVSGNRGEPHSLDLVLIS
jgi:hypothetical protein